MLTMSNEGLTGHVLAGRYRLLRALAAGSSGRAFVAEDLQLRRRVAVKVLHEELVNDAALLARFRQEARIVASLSHPNIVTVHDWGDDPVPFMVLELCGGGSLAAMLRQGRVLSPSQTARIGLEAVAGLAHAHAQGLVHRDVKPANLLFDQHGSLRVADFGIARLQAGTGRTDPAGGLVGTARYAAPEQGSGADLDGRTDLYSLALVLVEAATGNVPLVGDTPLRTLALRATEPLEAPVHMGALGVVVERAGLPYPDERYTDAPAMGRALQAAMTMLPDPAPLPLAGLGVELDDAAPTEAAVSERTVLARPRPAPGDVDAPAPPPQTALQRTGRLVPWVVGLMVVLGLVAAGIAAVRATGPVVHAPHLVGSSRQDATTVAGDAGLLVKVEGRVRTADPAGTVISQDPPPGASTGRGSEITVVLSAGPPPVALPAVVGVDGPDAKKRLRKAGFEVVVERVFHEQVPKGKVARQKPDAAKAPTGSTVTITVSRGPEPVAVPNVVALARDEAGHLLEEAGFAVVVAEEFSDAVDKGEVIRTDPVGGQDAVPGTEVTVTVSKGPETVDVPDVRGLRVEAATKRLEAAGLEVDVVGYAPGGKVKRTDPDPGVDARRGTTVTLFL